MNREKIRATNKSTLCGVFLSNDMVDVIIQALDDYSDELSKNSNGTLMSEQWSIYDYLKEHQESRTKKSA